MELQQYRQAAPFGFGYFAGGEEGENASSRRALGNGMPISRYAAVLKVILQIPKDYAYAWESASDLSHCVYCAGDWRVV